MERTYIIIPALEPEPGLCGRIVNLRDKIPSKIVVVDDGSGETYRKTFDQIAGMMIVLCSVTRKTKGKDRRSKPVFDM